MVMAYNFSNLKNKLADVKNWLSGEYAGLRTGRATPLLLDSIFIDSFGTKTPLKHIAAITSEDARTLRIAPWDKSQIGPIEKAIAEANLGVSTVPDDSGVRVIFPDLTAERRTALIKIAGEKLEEAKVSIRKEREKTWNDILAEEKEGGLSEDEKFRLKDELQKIVDAGIEELEVMTKHKEEEIKN